MTLNKNQQAFLALVRGGLWETEVQLLQYGDIDFKEVYRLAQELSVVGLVAAGLEHIIDVKPSKDVVLTFAGDVLQLEQCNTAMNNFIRVLLTKMLNSTGDLLLVKGQGVAQCYERPLWRTCGDVDLLCYSDDYIRYRDTLISLADSADIEIPEIKHQGVFFDSWEVELQGTLRGLWSVKVDNGIDQLQKECFEGRHFRLWKNGEIDVLLPAVDYDVLFVFTHILKHFFRGGIGLRQICDWCRMLWIYRGKIDENCLEERLRNLDLMTEWIVFSSYVVDYLGTPASSVPLYSSHGKWSRRAKRMNTFFLEVGNFGHNRDINYYNEKSFVMRKAISLWRHTADYTRHFFVFPVDSLKAWAQMIATGIKEVIK